MDDHDDDSAAHHRRWPRWVYDGGSDPDYRFSFANERTFLAWIQIGIGLVAAGVGVHSLASHLFFRDGIALIAILLGGIATVTAWWRWAASERAMRRSQTLPSFGSGALLVVGVLAIAVIVAGVVGGSWGS